jgi:hypothetical protein
MTHKIEPDQVIGRSRSNRQRRVLIVMLLAQLALAAFGLAKTYAEPSLAQPRFDRIQVAPDKLPLTPESGQPIATQYAAQWKDDARLVIASMHLDWPDSAQSGTTTDLPPDGFLLYVFVSGDDAIAINLDRGSGNLNGTAVSKHGGDVWRTLDLTTFSKAATVAGLTAEIDGGQAYRRACPDRRHASDIAADVIAGSDGSMQSVWTVTYQQDRHGDVNDVVVRMNATTGEVIQKDLTSRNCDDK